MQPKHSSSDVHGQLPFIEAFIIIGIAAMLGAAVIVWHGADSAEKAQAAQQEAALSALRNAAVRANP